ncbi:MAG TPA: TonB-dependent receptor [Candidatus Binatia bacterium]|nr:TonB-dependent receptor [Candidatus Binatia bacterium]
MFILFSVASARAQGSSPPADSSSAGAPGAVSGAGGPTGAPSDAVGPTSTPAGAVTAAATPSSEMPRYLLPPIVVTAERAPVRLDRTPSDVTVVARERLDRDQALFAADPLRAVPAVDVQRSGSTGKLTDVRLRGADPRHTLVLFDGIPLNGPWAGTFDFADLPGAGWGQIEVMGGPASSLYGTGAVGGVIQFLSPWDPGPTRLRAGAEVGDRATLRQSAEWRAAPERWTAGAYASRVTSDGDGPRDEYDGLATRVHAAAPVGPWRLAFSGLATRGVKQVPYDYRFDLSDFLTHEVLDPNTEERDRVITGRVSAARELGRLVSLEGEVSGFGGRIDYENRPDTTGGDYVDTRLDNAREIAGVRARIGTASRSLLAGAEYREESVTRDDDSRYGGFGSVTHVDHIAVTRSLYAQAHAEWRRLLADAGVRLDDHSRYGAIGVPRVAIAVPIREVGLKLRGGYGRAFTAPTLSDLYYPLYGSETLRPERSRTWEAGADGNWVGGRLEARATWHTTRFRDLIQSNSFFTADNIGRARIEGGEASLRVAPSRRIAVGGWAARLIAKNLNEGAGSDRRLAKRPAWRAGGWIEAAPATWATASASVRWTDSMRDPFDFVDPQGHLLSGDTPGYAALDLGATASLARWIPAEARVRLTNALDRRYQEVKGYPAPGRRITVGFAYAR